MNKQENNTIRWYESGNAITSLIIIVILVSIICSQSFLEFGSSLSLFTSIINHNAIYLLVLVYFVLLKTHFGKRFFNYLNVFLFFIYAISAVTSLLTLFQSFALNTILLFFENVLILVYLVHTMFRDTRVWNELKLGSSPFNEIKNDNYYYLLVVLAVFILVVNLISTIVVSGLIISVLDSLYILLFGRYFYLYREYLDYHSLDVNNESNSNELKDGVDKNNENLDKNDSLRKTEKKKTKKGEDK